MKQKNNLLRSFINAFRGIGLLFAKERNAQIHLLALVLVSILGVVLHISMNEWLILLLLFALIISLEAVNSALERQCDLIQPEQDPFVRDIKDLAAGAVLWSAIIAVIAGGIIFVPKIITYFIQ